METTLYSFAPQDRSGKIQWLLKELESPFRIRTLDGDKNEHKTPEFMSISPLGLVPALQYGDATLFESGAIAIYLTEKMTSTKCLAPGLDSPHRGDFLKWVLFATTSLDPLLVKVFRTKEMSEEERKNHLDGIYSEFQRTAVLLEQILSQSQFVVGGEFSAADIMLAQPLDWANTTGLLEKHPILQDYLGRLKLRPACIESCIFQK
jgi:glutathione S-transferase